MSENERGGGNRFGYLEYAWRLFVFLKTLQRKADKLLARYCPRALAPVSHNQPMLPIPILQCPPINITAHSSPTLPRPPQTPPNPPLF